MYILFSVLIIIVCILLTLIVLVQNSKGGGLASNFTSSGQVTGVRKTADFLEKATWTLACGLLLFSLLASFAIPSDEEQRRSAIEEQIQRIDPGSQSSFPTSVPEPQQPGDDD